MCEINRNLYSLLLCFSGREMPWLAGCPDRWREREGPHDEHSSPRFSWTHGGHTAWWARYRRDHGSLPSRESKTAHRDSVKRGTGTKWTEMKLFRQQSAAQEREVISFSYKTPPGSWNLWHVLRWVPWGGRGCLQHPGLCVWISCWWTWQPGWHPESHGVSLSESKKHSHQVCFH